MTINTHNKCYTITKMNKQNNLQMILLLQLLLLLSILQLSTSSISSSSTIQTKLIMERTLDNQTIGTLVPGGDTKCPCITTPLPAEVMPTQMTYNGVNTSIESYGVGCAYHDLDKTNCTASCDKSKPSVLCLDSWCRMAWCYVDPNNCQLQIQRSALYPNSDRFYSYATCGYPDRFKTDYDSVSKADSLRVGLTANTGGWFGTYRKEGENTGGLLEGWTGPMIEFLQKVTESGNISLEIVKPPPFLVEKSFSYFGNSSFDLCIYATSLGFMDLCVSAFTITEQRATTTDWLVVFSQDLYLITMNEGWNETIYDSFKKNNATIYQAFEADVWIFVILFVIPCFGLLTVAHERGHKGSAFPTAENILETNDETGEQLVMERHIPISSDITKSIYIAFLSIVQMEWGQSVVSLGGHLNLIGIAFFILTFLAVYTANLAAILTKRRKTLAFATLKDAVKAKKKICADRSIVDLTSKVYGIDKAFFLPDPEDNEPGFACPTCNSRQLVFDLMNPSKEKIEGSTKKYCDVAVAALEDLEALQSEGHHCNKTWAKEPVAEVFIGFPVFESRSAAILPLFVKIQNEGFIDEKLLKGSPESVCPALDVRTGGETASLDIEQLTGIWFVTGGLSTLSLIVTLFLRFRERRKKKHVMAIMGRDQMGQSINLLERGDSFVWERVALDEETGRMLVVEPFQLSNKSSVHQVLIKGVKKSVKGVANKALELSKSRVSTEASHRSDTSHRTGPRNLLGMTAAVTNVVRLSKRVQNSRFVDEKGDLCQDEEKVYHPPNDSTFVVARSRSTDATGTSSREPTPLIDDTPVLIASGERSMTPISVDSPSALQAVDLISFETPLSQQSLQLIDPKAPSSTKGERKKRKKNTPCQDFSGKISNASTVLIDTEVLSSQVSMDMNAVSKGDIKKKKEKLIGASLVPVVNEKHKKIRKSAKVEQKQDSTKGKKVSKGNQIGAEPSSKIQRAPEHDKGVMESPKKTTKPLKKEPEALDESCITIAPDKRQRKKSSKIQKSPKSPKSPKIANSGKTKEQMKSSVAPLPPFLDQFDPDTSSLSLRAAFEALLAAEEKELENKKNHIASIEIK